MKHDILAPLVGESITEVSLLKWSKNNGDYVKSGELLLEIESDKATVEIVAEKSGALTILKQAGERVAVNSVIGSIDDSVSASAAPSASTVTPAAPVAVPPTGAKAPPPPPPASSSAPSAPVSTEDLSPAVRKAVVEKNLNPATIEGTGKNGRITKGDVIETLSGERAPKKPEIALPISKDKTGDRRVPMPMIRQRIAERLVYAQHTAAILTTFNEIDMQPIMNTRKQHKDAFEKKYGTKLSFMSFFTRGCALALQKNPAVNASIDGKDIVYHDYQDIGVAVGTERGLVVPVLRGAGTMSFADIEKGISDLALKARNGKLSIADMSGGTFTISNGGTYGSLLSTPILNPPQSGILGMHKIQERPMAIDGKVEIRPMMYLALSYDHRIIDGKEAVTFLVNLKEFLEKPESLGLDFI